MEALSVQFLTERKQPGVDLILVSHNKGLGVVSSVLSLHSDVLGKLNMSELSESIEIEGRRVPRLDVSDLLSFEALESVCKWAYRLLDVDLSSPTISLDDKAIHVIVEGAHALQMTDLLKRIDNALVTGVKNLPEFQFSLMPPPRPEATFMFGPPNANGHPFISFSPPPSISAIQPAPMLNALRLVDEAIKYGLKSFETALVERYVCGLSSC